MIQPDRLPITSTLVQIAVLVWSMGGVVACGSSERDVAYLGPVEGDASPSDANQEQEVPPGPEALSWAACAAGALVGQNEANVVRSVSVIGDRAVVASAQSVSAWSLDAAGCPAERVTSFGTNGEVEVEATSAASVPGGRAIVTSAVGTMLLNAAGEVVGRCRLGGGEVIARLVTMGADGNGVALFTRSPLYAVRTDLAWPTGCEVSLRTLTPEPYAIAAAARLESGWVTVEQKLATSPLFVAWYDEGGNQVRTSEAWSGTNQPGHLCTATAVAVTASRVVVNDAGCGRLVVFDSTSGKPVGMSAPDGTPRGVAVTASGNALVAVARRLGDGAVATFAVVDLP